MPHAHEVTRRPGGRSERIRVAVVAAALRELSVKGVAGLSLDSVAQRAGVHRATLYRRWGTREALILEVMRQQAREAVPVPNTGDLRTDLIRLAGDAVRNAVANGPVLRALIAELPHNPALADVARRFWRERLRLDGEIVRRAIERGEVPRDTDPRALIEGVLGPLHLRFLLTGVRADRKAIERAVELVVAGRASRAGPPSG